MTLLKVAAVVMLGLALVLTVATVAWWVDPGSTHNTSECGR